MPVLTNWDTLQGVMPRPGVVRKALTGKNSMMTLNEIKPGTTPWLHSHPHEQLIYIVSGRAEFVLGNEVLTLKAGDLLLVPPGAPQSLKVIGDETVLNIDIFSPIREDYL